MSPKADIKLPNILLLSLRFHFLQHFCWGSRRLLWNQAPVVRKLDNGLHPIKWIMQLVSLILIRWIVIYPVESATQRLTNRGHNTRHKSLKHIPVLLNFLENFLHPLFTPLFSLKCAPLLPQSWATRILKHWDDCNTQINIGKGETHTSVSRFLTSIAGFSWRHTLNWVPVVGGLFFEALVGHPETNATVIREFKQRRFWATRVNRT